MRTCTHYPLFYFLLICSLLSCSYRHDKIERKKVFVADFLNYYFTQVAKKDNPVILDLFTKNENSDCMKKTLAKSNNLGLASNDVLIIDSIAALDLKFAPKLLSVAMLPSNAHFDLWPSFKKKYKDGFYVIEPPIVNERLNRIVFSYGHYCGDRCGNGEVLIYEKQHGKWLLVSRDCQWVS